MEGFEVEYLEVKQKEIILDYDGKKYSIKKPSALKLVDIHTDGGKIDAQTDLKGLVLFQIQTLIDLGLPKELADSLDLSTLKNCFMSLSQDPVKKK
jgi:hypothetical protein